MYLPNTAFCTALLASSLLLANPSVATGGTNQFKLSPSKLDSYWVPSRDSRTQNVLQLQRKLGRSYSGAYLSALRNGSQVDGVYGSEEVDVTDDFLNFATNVKVGGKSYEMFLDTGSSDTWLPKANFQCLSPGNRDFVPQANCRLASTYTPTSTFRPIDNRNFQVNFAGGESLLGTFGREQVTVAGITVKNQQIALVDQAEWFGDGATSGVLGLAFPAFTNAFLGNDFTKQTPQKIYNPVFTNMYTEGFVAPLFSIALDRNTGGQLAIGGLPPVEFLPIFASSPFQLLSASSNVRNTVSTAYTLYVITTRGFSYDNSSAAQWTWQDLPKMFGEPSDKTQVQVIIDTGTPYIIVPAAVADAVNALFQPRPLFRSNTGFDRINCDAKPPRFGVKIGFETFYINPKDMIVKQKDGKCVSAVVAAGPGGANVLGDAFLKNVLAVFDVGAQMMRFAARENY